MIGEWQPGEMMHDELVVWLQTLRSKKDSGLPTITPCEFTSGPFPPFLRVLLITPRRSFDCVSVVHTSDWK